MGLFGPKTVLCPAGRWTTLISNAFVQMPKTWSVTLAATDGGPVAGAYVETKSSWIIPGSPVEGVLAPAMAFERGLWNTFHSVRVLPDRDMTATIA